MPFKRTNLEVDIPPYKRCRLCDLTKPSNEFDTAPMKTNRDGLQAYCKECSVKARRRRRKKKSAWDEKLKQRSKWNDPVATPSQE